MATKNDIFSHIYTIETALSSVPIRKGQIIVCTDSGKLYIDTASKRIHTNDVVRVDSFSSLPLAPLDKLYITIDTGKIYLYINDEWQPIVTEDEFAYAVRRYDATIDPESQQVVITDGTPVTDLRIGDEIVTADGVYKKTKDSITTGSIPDDGSHILVSGCTDPTDVNGIYVATGEPNTWKNETSNNWISKLDGYGGPWWFIASSQAPSNPGDTNIRYRAIAVTAQNPWDANFTPSNAAGTISVQKYSDLVSKTDTIDLFEYASLPVEPENIVQSVNGNKPDTEGNVTIEIPPAGLESVTTGDGLSGNGTTEDPVKLDLSNYSAANQADGLAVIGSNGKLPDSILPTYVKSVNSVSPDSSGNVTIELPDGGLTSVSVSTGLTGNGTSGSPIALDLSNYTGALNITATSNASIRGGTSGNYDITIGDVGHGITVYAAQNNPTVSISSFGSSGNSSTKITLKSSNVSVEPTTGAGTFSVDVASSGSVKFTAGNIYFNNNASNTAGGFAIVEEDGKLPESILPVMNQSWTKVTINQSDFSVTDDTYGGSYKELDGICTVEIYDADGFKVEFDLKCDFGNNKTRIYIPSSLAASSISNWTLLYTVKTIA